MKTLNTILVAVDFSTGSRAALEQAARIAHLQGASLHVLHVVDSEAFTAHAESHESRYEDQARTATASSPSSSVARLTRPPAMDSPTLRVRLEE